MTPQTLGTDSLLARHALENLGRTFGMPRSAGYEADGVDPELFAASDLGESFPEIQEIRSDYGMSRRQSEACRCGGPFCSSVECSAWIS